MNVTIKQVAQKANFSVATVSRVLNTKGQVSEETRRRVLEVAKRLRYVPNIAAYSLITSQTNTIGVLLPDLHHGIHKKNKHRRRHQVLATANMIRKSCGASLKKTNNFSKSCASPLKAQNESFKKTE